MGLPTQLRKKARRSQVQHGKPFILLALTGAATANCYVTLRKLVASDENLTTHSAVDFNFLRVEQGPLYLDTCQNLPPIWVGFWP